MPALPPLPPSLGRQVTTRNFNLLEMVALAWGGEFSAPDHRIYCFGNDVRCFDSTDLGTTGIYSRGLSTATAFALSAIRDPINTTAIDLSWTLSTIYGSLIDEYQIWRSVNGGPFVVIQTLEAYLPTFRPAYTDANLTLSNSYAYFVVAIPCLGNSAQSNTVTFAQATAPVLSGLEISSTEIDLTWTASTVPGSTIANYHLFRSVDGGGFTSLTTTAGNVLLFHDTTVTSGHTYRYFVFAIPVAGSNSPNSNIVTLSTGVSVFHDWGPWVVVPTTSSPYQPGLDALAAGLSNVFLVLVGEIISGNSPDLAYGGTAPISTTPTVGANGDAWMFVFDLSNHTPANNHVTAAGGSGFNFAYNALVVSGATGGVLGPQQAQNPLTPLGDIWSPATGSLIVGFGRGVGPSIPSVVSDDPATMHQTTSPNSYSNGLIQAFWQLPNNATVTYTWDATVGPASLANIGSFDLST